MTCKCGCGQLAPIATKNNTKNGYIKGQPRRFVAGHQHRKSPVDYIVDSATGCWVWQLAKYPFGYGAIGIAGTTIGAHRVSYAKYNGPIPGGMNVLHRCDNPPCINPEHLFLGTQSDNLTDMANKGRHWKQKVQI